MLKETSKKRRLKAKNLEEEQKLSNCARPGEQDTQEQLGKPLRTSPPSGFKMESGVSLR